MVNLYRSLGDLSSYEKHNKYIGKNTQYSIAEVPQESRDGQEIL